MRYLEDHINSLVVLTRGAAVRLTSPRSAYSTHGDEALIASLMDVLYRGAPPDSNVDEKLTRKRIEALWRRGHHSVFELMGFDVLVECSRACHTQIRHCMASYWSESQRYVDYSRQELRLIAPKGFPVELLEEGVKAYMRLREAGQRPEWARLVLPAAAVRFVVQMNAREFFTVFAPLRCSASAQAEIRHICWQMFAVAWRLWPTLAKLAWGATRLARRVRYAAAAENPAL